MNAASPSPVALILSLALAFGCRAEEPAPTRILLLGDSTVITSYLADEARPQSLLKNSLLNVDTPGEVINAADNGEFIARYLLSGAYEHMRASTPGADIIVIRFGANDEKRVSPEEFSEQLKILISLLQEDFPGSCIILETGVYMDPKHYSFDRNKTLLPYWEKTREIAEAHHLPCSDVYAAMERATLAGNWDLRIRKTGKNESRVIDASLDDTKATNLAWFSDIHPNTEGVRVSAEELTSCIARTFPDKLPSGNRARERSAKSAEEYTKLLNFTPDRLAEIKNPPWRRGLKNESLPADALQQSIRPEN